MQYCHKYEQIRYGQKKEYGVFSQFFCEEVPMKSIKVVAAIILHDNQISATQRGYGDFKGGWEFPGCKVEPDASP